MKTQSSLLVVLELLHVVDTSPLAFGMTFDALQERAFVERAVDTYKLDKVPNEAHHHKPKADRSADLNIL